MRQALSGLTGWVLAGVLAGLATAASAESVILDAVARGWYTDTGIGNHHESPPVTPDNERNFAVGDLPGQVNRNFFVFDLSGLQGDITSASLKLFNPPNGFASQDLSENYAVFDVSTDITTLIRHTTGPEGLDIYNDLGSGIEYGTYTATAADDDTQVTIPLDAAALATLNQTSGLFAFGGAITTLDQSNHNEYLFGFSGEGDRLGTQLVMEVEGIPEPSILMLLGVGTLGAIGSSWRLRKQRA